MHGDQGSNVRFFSFHVQIFILSAGLHLNSTKKYWVPDFGWGKIGKNNMTYHATQEGLR
jgi:hypothetical protein